MVLLINEVQQEDEHRVIWVFWLSLGDEGYSLEVLTSIEVIPFVFLLNFRSESRENAMEEDFAGVKRR